MPKPVLKIAEPREPYNTKEDLFELAQEYKDVYHRQQKDNWALARLAHEAAQKYDLKEFAKLAEENYQTLKTLSYIAGRYTKYEEEYYGTTLLFAHFIAAVKSDSRIEWLKKAGDEGWSAARLRREMNPPAPKKDPEPVKPEPIKPQPVPAKTPQGRTLEEMVEALNWYLINDKRALELAASNALLFMCLLLGEERKVYFDPDTGQYEISVIGE